MPAPDAPPHQIGPYRIDRLIGEGGMGTVYEAFDPRLERRVALKVPTLSPSNSQEVLARFQHEAKAAAKLQHPNICRVFDLGEFEGDPYLVMEYIEGRKLIDVLTDGVPLPTDRALALVVQLAHAMQEAHTHQVLHRDLTPRNILIDRRDEPIIVDFGLARLLDSTSVPVTRPGDPLGTPAYMAPEQVNGEVQNMGHRCDIYSLGVILFKLLTGRVPFRGPNREALFREILDGPVPSLLAHRPDLGRRLEKVCRKAMARRPADRYESMAQFAAALEAARPAPPARDSGSARPSWLWLMVGATFLAGLGAALALFSEELSLPSWLSLLPSAALPAWVAVCWATFGRNKAKAPRANEPGRSADPQPPSSDSLSTFSGATPEPEASSDPEALERRLASERDAHEALTRKHERVTSWLSRTYLVRTYHQPVLLVGSRNVGKTSLVKQWHAPWDHSAVEGTQAHRVCEVPVLPPFVEPDLQPHEAAPDVLVKVRAQLSLRVHDFPGELQAQQLIRKIVCDETKAVRKKSRKDLGVVLVLLFDAEEAVLGIRPETDAYYNGDLFRDLHKLVVEDVVGLKRMILVFNKFDLLKAHFPPHTQDAELVQKCLTRFAPILARLHSPVHPDKICPVPTVLARQDRTFRSRGASVVKGEAARPIVEAFRGVAAAEAQRRAPEGQDAALGW